MADAAADSKGFVTLCITVRGKKYYAVTKRDWLVFATPHKPARPPQKPRSKTSLSSAAQREACKSSLRA